MIVRKVIVRDRTSKGNTRSEAPRRYKRKTIERPRKLVKSEKN